MSSRMWLAIVLAPIAGGAVYAWIGYVTFFQHVTGPQQPSLAGGVVVGSALGLAFELVVLIPFYLALRHWQRLSAVAFVLGGVAAWFIFSTGVLVALGYGWSDGSATADSMLPVGGAVVVAFWLLGWAEIKRRERDPRLTTPVRIALSVFVLPFLVGGILLAGIVHSWLIGGWSNAPLSGWSFLLLVCLTVTGIFLGALLAYGILIFFLAWLKPNSPLLAESELNGATTKTQRILLPA